MLKVREAVVKYRAHREQIRSVSNPQDVFDFFSKMLEGETRENLYGVYLTTRNGVVCFEKIGIGIDNTCLVDTKGICRTALLVGASVVILVHNHPSGVAEPSDDDMKITRVVAGACRTLGIELLDHIVVAGSTFASLKERGML